MAYTYNSSPEDAKRFFYVLATLADSSAPSLPTSAECDTISDLETNFGTSESAFSGEWVLLGALEEFTLETSADDERDDTAGNKIKLSEMVSIEMTDLSQNYTDIRVLDRKKVNYLVIDPTLVDGSDKVKYTEITNMITNVNRSLSDNTWTTKLTAERKHRDIDDFVDDESLS